MVLLDEYERWTGDTEARARPRARGAGGAGLDRRVRRPAGNGYVEYERRNEETGLENQCWKDSWDSIAYRDGTLPGFPRATCELQGYAYDAKMRGARLAREVWDDPALADKLEKEAAELKRRFNRDFWIEDGEFFALALDADGRQVDSLTSNIGHLLWSGIVDKSKAKAVARHLMGHGCSRGWGVRTMAEGEGRYNPIGYHVGTVWPHDNSFIAWGLRRYGYKEEAARIADGILEAAEFFDGRLPEAFGGYPRDDDEVPGRVPDRVQPAGLVDRHAAAVAAHDARPRADRRPPDRRPGAAQRHRPPRAARHPGRWGRIDAFGRGRVEVAPRARRARARRTAVGRSDVANDENRRTQ